MEINYAKIGERIRYMRVQRGISQEDLAEFADISNVYISNVESGTKCPSLKVIVAVAKALRVSTDSILVDSLLPADDGRSSILFSLLSDCTVEENDILVRNMTQLKENLRQYKISK